MSRSTVSSVHTTGMAMLLGVPAGETARALEFLRGYADIYAEEVTG